MRISLFILWALLLFQSCSKEKLNGDNDFPENNDPPPRKLSPSGKATIEFIDYLTGEPVKGLILIKEVYDSTGNYLYENRYFLNDSSRFHFELSPGHSYSLHAEATNYFRGGIREISFPFVYQILDNWLIDLVLDSANQSLSAKRKMLRAAWINFHIDQVKKYKSLNPEKKYLFIEFEISSYETLDTTLEPLYSTSWQSNFFSSDELLDSLTSIRLPDDLYTKILWHVVAVDESYFDFGYGGPGEILATGEFPFQRYSSRNTSEVLVEF